MKVLEKRHIIKEKKVKYVTVEKDVLNLLYPCPLVIRLFYTFQDTSHLYFCLEYAENGDLLGLIRKFGGLDLTSCKFYSLEILSALFFIHSKKVVHRDLKPENILLDSKWHMKLTDFGSAKIVSGKADELSLTNLTSDTISIQPPSLTSSSSTVSVGSSSSFVGTAEYVSPELLNEKHATYKSDIWALGCIMYQMIVNKPPFKASNDYQIFQRILRLDFKIPSYFPPTLGSLIQSIITLDPSIRPSLQEIYSNDFFTSYISILNTASDTNTMEKMRLEEFEIWTHEAPHPCSFEPEGGWTPEFKREQSDILVVSTMPMPLASPTSPDTSPESPMSPTSEQWKLFLYADEKILYSGHIQKKRYFFGKTHSRQLILTDKPRLLYIDVENMVEKGEIPWEEISHVDVKDSFTFSIVTADRTWVMTDMDGNASLWKEAILKLKLQKD